MITPISAQISLEQLSARRQGVALLRCSSSRRKIHRVRSPSLTEPPVACAVHALRRFTPRRRQNKKTAPARLRNRPGFPPESPTTPARCETQPIPLPSRKTRSSVAVSELPLLFGSVWKLLHLTLLYRDQRAATPIRSWSGLSLHRNTHQPTDQNFFSRDIHTCPTHLIICLRYTQIVVRAFYTPRTTNTAPSLSS